MVKSESSRWREEVGKSQKTLKARDESSLTSNHHLVHNFTIRRYRAKSCPTSFHPPSLRHQLLLDLQQPPQATRTVRLAASPGPSPSVQWASTRSYKLGERPRLGWVEEQLVSLVWVREPVDAVAPERVRSSPLVAVRPSLQASSPLLLLAGRKEHLLWMSGRTELPSVRPEKP